MKYTKSLNEALQNAHLEALCLKACALTLEDADSHNLFREIADKIKQCRELLNKHEWKTI